MPYLEFQCPNGHITEKFFKSIQEGYDTDYVDCDICYHDATLFFPTRTAKKIFSRPYPAHLLGKPGGYHKPSPLKRHSTKLISAKGNS